jgi:hypothetical protein
MDSKKTTASHADSLDAAELGSVEKLGLREPGIRAWAKLLSVETGGIQRVTEEERKENTTHVWNACTFW